MASITKDVATFDTPLLIAQYKGNARSAHRPLLVSQSTIPFNEGELRADRHVTAHTVVGCFGSGCKHDEHLYTQG